MILRALYDYYERNRDKLPAFGREEKEIAFLIVIDKDGHFIRFEDRRSEDSKHAQTFLVKKHVGRSSGVKANYLYDNSAYVLGFSDKKDIASNQKYFQSFKEKVNEIYHAIPGNEDIRAVHLFYEHTPEEILSMISQDSLWEDIKKNLNKKYSTFSFLIQGDTEIIAQKDELLNIGEEEHTDGNRICIITGEKGNTVETTTSTMIPGSQATAKLVSFQINSGYDSYGKKKGDNAPISVKAEFEYTTALNHLLATDSRNKFLIGNRTYLFWASSSDEAGQKVEKSVFDMFHFNSSSDDDPDRGIEQVRKVFQSIYSGTLKTSLEDRFYIMGLAPNAARIAVVYWAEIPLQKFSAMILRHFEDMKIVDTRKEKWPYMGLRSMLSAITLSGKSSDALPNLADALVKSVFQGQPYPYTLFAGCIRRIRAEQSVTITRAAILKAYLNRQEYNLQKIETMLDLENKNQGYLCGRLFAVIDKIQGDANSMHSIRERYINSASATPSAVFATILNQSFHHLEKLSEGKKIYYEKVKQEIIDKLSADGFPSHLDLQNQGRFFVGFYQQLQWFYTKKEDQTTEK